MAVGQSSALYYPTIEIRNEGWLRQAVLYWDSISTIVPASVKDPYKGRLARELAHAGVLQPMFVAPNIDQVSELATSVLEFLTDPAAANVLAPKRKASSRLHRDKLALSNDLSRVHPDKLPYEIHSQLNHLISGDGFARVDSRFAEFYMTLLATSVAKRLGYSVVTDSLPASSLAVSALKGVPGPRFFTDRSRMLLDERSTRNAPKKTAEGLLADLTLEGFNVPASVSVAKLLKFRDDHEDELAVFRNELATLVSDIPDDPSIEALRTAVADRYKSKVLPAMRVLKRSLAAQAWDTGTSSLMKLSTLSAGTGTALVVFAGLSAPVALMTAAGVSLTATAVTMVSERKKARAASPYAYLLAMDRQWK